MFSDRKEETAGSNGGRSESRCRETFPRMYSRGVGILGYVSVVVVRWWAVFVVFSVFLGGICIVCSGVFLDLSS